MTLEELGRRAVACKRWRWLPGMRIVNPRTALGRGRMAGARYCTLGFDDEAFVLESKNAGSMDTPSKNEEDWHPDLSDPATLGCLLALVREAYADPAFCIQCVAGYWYEDSDKRELVPRSNETEAEALVAALEAAP